MSLMEVFSNLKVLKIYLLLRMNWITVSNISNIIKEVKVKVKVIKKETSLIRNNNSTLLKRLTIRVTKEINLFELFMIILISKEIIRVLSVIE